jgi:hypothetical protein
MTLEFFVRSKHPRRPGPRRTLTLALGLVFGVLVGTGLRASGTFDVTAYGAIGDGATPDTASIQGAINAASAAGGGVVLIPVSGTGTYLSDNLTLASDVDLSIAAGATLEMLPYGVFTGGTTDHFIDAKNLQNVTITGGGVIDGQGRAWWNAYIADNTVTRPGTMLYFSGCTNVTVQNVTLSNAPMVNQQYEKCVGVLIDRETVYAPYASASDNISPNTDGMDIASTNMLIQDCSISVGDDVIAIGSSSAIAQNITITGCTFGTGHGLSLGSHTKGGVNGLYVSHCTFNGTQYGLRFKSDRGNGGLAQNLYYQDLTMTGIVYYPIYMYSYYDVTPVPGAPSDDPGGPATLTSTTPQWVNLNFSDISATTASGSKAPLELWALPEAPATSVSFDDVRLWGVGSAELYHAAGVSFTCTCRINGTAPSASNVATYDAVYAVLPCTSPTATATATSTSTAASATPTPTRTFSVLVSASATPTAPESPSATPTFTQRATASSTPQFSPSPTATPTATRVPDTPTLTGTMTATGTSESDTVTVTATATGTRESDTVTATATGARGSDTVTGTETPTVLAATGTPTQSPIPPSPSATATDSGTVTVSSPSGTATGTATESAATATAVPPTSSPTVATPEDTALPTATASPSATLEPTVPTETGTGTRTPTFTPSGSASVSPSATGTRTLSVPSATQSPTQTVAALETPVSTPDRGVPRVDRLLPWPNPDPTALAVHAEGPIPSVNVRVWSVALNLCGTGSAGPLKEGWNRIVLPASLSGLAPGLYFVTLDLPDGSRVAGPERLVRLR